MKKELKKQEEEYEEVLNKNIKTVLKELEFKLSEESSQSKSSLIEEKENIKTSLRNEYFEKFEAEVKKLDKQHFSNKRELDKSQEIKMKEELLIEEQNKDRNLRDKEQVFLIYFTNLIF